MKWLWLILLLLVIAAAVWLLLRRPGGSDSVSGSTDPALHPDAGGQPGSPAGGYAADTAAPADQNAAPGGYGQQASPGPYDQAADSETPTAPGGSEYTEPDPAAEAGGYSPETGPEAGYTDTATGESAPSDMAAETPSYETPTAGDETAYEAPGAGETATSSDYEYTDTAPAAEASDYSQEATYTDTATGETTAADTVPEGAAVPETAEGTSEVTPEESAAYDTDADSGSASGAAAAAAAGAGAAAWSTQDDTGAAADSAHPQEQHPQSPAAEPTWGEGEPVQTAADFGDEAGGTEVGDDTAAATEAGYAEPTTDAEYAEAPSDAAPVPPVGDAPPVESAGDAPPVESADTGDYGYDEAQAGAAAGSYGQGPFGAGSAEPAEDGSGPAGWSIKGNAGSMLFHTPESPSYEQAKAEVWFETEEAARAAGFAHWDRKRR